MSSLRAIHTSRRRVVRAIAPAVALLALATPAAAQSSTTAPVVAPPPGEVPSTPASEQNEIVNSWTLTPKGSDDPGAAVVRENLSYSAEAGATIQDEVTLYNFSNVPLNFRVYATDAFNGERGAFSLLEGDEAPRDVGAWVTVEQEHITLSASQQVTIPITVTVPADATPGDHVGAVLASSPSVSRTPDGKVIEVDRRTGTRLYVRVNGPIRQDLAIENLEATYRHDLNPLKGAMDVSYTVVNRGNVRLAGATALSLAGPFGVAEKELPAEAFPELLPGQRITLVKKIEDVPAPGLVTTTVRLEPAAGSAGEATATPTSRRALTVAPPIAVLLLLLMALFAVLGWRAYARHRRPPALPAVSRSQTEPQPT
jgi:hypothetical protein